VKAKNRIDGISLGLKLTILAVVFAGASWAGPPPQKAQELPKPPQSSSPMGGVSTGGSYAPVKDAKNRPITAGGFVDGAPVVFEDATEKSGLGKFHHVSGTPEKTFILEAPGSGVAILDYDNDGWPDIYLLNGSTYDALRGKAKPPRAALYHNNHDGTFTDVTDRAGVANERWGFGVAVGDFDNDGWPDLYVANFGKNRLYHNNHDGTFTDVAEKAGVTLGGWSTGVTFGDYDGDGRLDLYVAGYVKFDIDHPPVPGTVVTQYSFCQYRGKPVMCGPRGLPGERNHLFHNNGDGTFTEVSEKAGVANEQGYYGFGAIFADVSDDGRVDLVVANDSTPNYLFLNKGDGTFEDYSYASGFALNESGREQASMGLAAGDYRNDGRLSLFVTNFSDDYFTLYQNEGDTAFTDVSFQAGIAETTIPFLGWGAGFIDYDNDGFKDLLTANGHVYPAVDDNDWGMTYRQRPLLFRNLNGSRFQPVPAATGSGLATLVSARGAAFGDLFNDGKIDVVLNNVDGPPTLLRNVVNNGNNWLDLKLVGGPKSPRDAIGAKAFLTAGGITQRGDVISGGSYCSSSDLRLHFGLGKASRVDKLEIRWPSRDKELVQLSGINRVFTIAEGKGVQEAGTK
jgi:enediyne biosynthesis protein E4